MSSRQDGITFKITDDMRLIAFNRFNGRSVTEWMLSNTEGTCRTIEVVIIPRIVELEL
jgi:hypothetical protein